MIVNKQNRDEPTFKGLLKGVMITGFYRLNVEAL